MIPSEERIFWTSHIFTATDLPYFTETFFYSICELFHSYSLSKWCKTNFTIETFVHVIWKKKKTKQQDWNKLKDWNLFEKEQILTYQFNKY